MALDKTLQLAVFISGRGSNLQSLIDACAQDDFPARIVVVVSNKADAYGLERAKTAGIATEIVSHKDLNAEDFERSLLERLEAYPVDLICLAGFMRILTSYFVDRWAGRMINIHPSLLPLYKGLDTHARALEHGDAESGCSIHYVGPEMDSGEIILQKRVPIEEADTVDTLSARVLEQEHIAYPEAVKKIALERLKR